MADTDDDYRIPTVSYRDEPKRADTYVLVELHIPGIRKKALDRLPSNADVCLTTKNNSFTVDVILRVKGSPIKYQYVVNQLPYSILTDDKMTYWQVKKDRICIYLAKEKPARWDAILSNSGLDQKP